MEVQKPPLPRRVHEVHGHGLYCEGTPRTLALTKRGAEANFDPSVTESAYDYLRMRANWAA